jgi:hypothetical protein
MFGYGIKGSEFDGLAFGNRKATWVRATATGVALVYAWWCAPRTALAKPPTRKTYSVLDKFPGLTQTPDAKLRKKIAEREAAEAAKKNKPQSDIAVLSEAELRGIRGGQGLPAYKVPNEPKQTVVQTTTGAAPGATTESTLRNPTQCCTTCNGDRSVRAAGFRRSPFLVV